MAEIKTSNKENAVRNASSRLAVKSNLICPQRRPVLGDLAKNNAVQKPKVPILSAQENKGINKHVLLRRQESVPNINGSKIPTTTIAKKKIEIIDPDLKITDIQLVPEYAQEIFEYLKELELQFAIKNTFLANDPITTKMRSILVNWLVEVHINFKFCLDTLYLCIAIVDRYLQVHKKVSKKIFQLVGATAMFVAAKYEEIYVPDISDYVYICDNTFTDKQFFAMELDILRTMDFRLASPTAISFIRRYMKIARATLEQHTLAKYILELALLEVNTRQIRPSLQAAASCCLSIAILAERMDIDTVWSPSLAHYSSYNYIELKPVLIEFAVMIVRSADSKYQNVRNKYSSPKFLKVSVNPKLSGNLVRKLAAAKK